MTMTDIAIIRALSDTKPAEILFVFHLKMILKGPVNGTPQTVSNIQVCLFFLEQICTLRSFDSEYCALSTRSLQIFWVC